MKHYFILVVAMALGNISTAFANSMAVNMDSLESSYVRCIESRFENSCWDKAFIGHFDKWQKNETTIITKSQEAYLAWLDGRSVYKVHLGPSVKRAGVFENRNYLIERDDGEVIGLHVGYRKILGSWYVYALQGGPDDKFIRSILDMPAPGTIPTK
ncbi:hypothetical protein J2W17_005528 [Pseudomonas lini]|uniref:hypothetical protein n=1 Tax=Pseudomonas lini TaxID=163011 RepID=UPI002788E9C6|nr:hypothetical protein [Pseudomonas lini]MDQ0126542.1 hypothetical protein [Pseudomonas lini]